LPPLKQLYNVIKASADLNQPALAELDRKLSAHEMPRTPPAPIYSGENWLSMNPFSGLGNHFDRECGPHSGFEAAYVRGQVFCEGDRFRSD
jgi:hypothetical protein